MEYSNFHNNNNSNNNYVYLDYLPDGNVMKDTSATTRATGDILLSPASVSSASSSSPSALELKQQCNCLQQSLPFTPTTLQQNCSDQNCCLMLMSPFGMMPNDLNEEVICLLYF